MTDDNAFVLSQQEHTLDGFVSIPINFPSFFPPMGLRHDSLYRRFSRIDTSCKEIVNPKVIHELTLGRSSRDTSAHRKRLLVASLHLDKNVSCQSKRITRLMKRQTGCVSLFATVPPPPITNNHPNGWMCSLPQILDYVVGDANFFVRSLFEINFQNIDNVQDIYLQTQRRIFK
jgi:hypothetical protein